MRRTPERKVRMDLETALGQQKSSPPRQGAFLWLSGESAGCWLTSRGLILLDAAHGGDVALAHFEQVDAHGQASRQTQLLVGAEGGMGQH